MASGTITKKEPINVIVTDTTSGTGALSVPTAILNGIFLNAYGTDTPYLIFRRDESYFMVKNAVNLSAVTNTSVTIHIVYIPA